MTLRRIWFHLAHNRSNRKRVTNGILCVIVVMTLMVSKTPVHLESRPGHVHLGLGSVHREGEEVHVGVGEGWRERLRGPLEADDPRVIAALREMHLHPPSTLPYQVDRYSQRLNYKDMDSWKFLHDQITKLFLGHPPGFFVEAGALDGEYLSNTLHLEMVYGWKGLLVEANPSSYNELRKKNRRAWSSNTCLAVTPYPKKSQPVPFEIQRFASIFQEMVLEMVDTHANAATSQALWVIRGSSFLSGEGGVAQKYNSRIYETMYSVVQCFPFATYLLALNTTKIDLLSLDIEGAEEKVLSTIPWDTIEISVLILEHYGDTEGKDAKYVERIEGYGYKLYNYNIDKDNIGDYIFVRNGFAKLDN